MKDSNLNSNGDKWMNTVELSIIIPVYNVKSYLERCLESVIGQCKNKNVEIILIDDGSKDGSELLCDMYAQNHSELVMVIHKENGGLSSARNVGLQRAKGKYISFLDSDDMFIDGFVSDMLSYMDQEPDFIHFNFCFENNGSYEVKGTKQVVEVNKDWFLDDLLKNKFECQICIGCYKKALFEDIYFPEGRNYEDIATLYKLILKSERICCVDYSYYIYNISNSASITKTITCKNMQDMYMSVNEMYEGILKYYKQQNKELTYLEYFRRNEYIYIYLKLVKIENAESLKQEIKVYLLKNRKYNPVKFRHYNYKKMIYFYVMALFGFI